MPDFDSQLLHLLSNRNIAADAVADGLDEAVQRQDDLTKYAAEHYDELLDIAYDHDNTLVRQNALWVVRILYRSDHQAVLNDVRLADPDQQMRAFAEAMLFGTLVDESRREASEHPQGVQAYIDERRRDQSHGDTSNPKSG